MYAELHAKSNFSFLRAASHPSELVERAHKLGYAALAVTDRNTLAGIVRAHGAAKDLGLKLLVGAEITPDDAPPIVLWATDRASYARLSRLITVGRRRAPKGKCQLSLADIDGHSKGLLAGVFDDPQSEHALCAAALHRYREIFSERCYLLAELRQGPDDRAVLDHSLELAREARVPAVAAGDVRYHHPRRRMLCDVLAAVRHGCTVTELNEGARAAAQQRPEHLPRNAQRYLKPFDEIAPAFYPHAELLERTLEVADRCQFSLDELRYEYPEELVPDGKTPGEHLADLTWRGACKRYPQGVPPKVQGLLKHELSLIDALRYEAYFLTVWDLVRFARSRDILCQGRGSAANSAVCYALGITAVDPETSDLLFERFISPERNEAPDIDVDFEHERREEVLQYLYEKYGRERVGMTAEVITYRARSAIRDVGKALGYSLEQVDTLAKNLESHRHAPDRGTFIRQRARDAGIEVESTVGRQLVELTDELIGFPRHLSQHVGGMVMTQGPLCELVPIENAAMADRTVIEWNKDDLDELGILKVDCLALGMLTAIRKCFDLVAKHYDRRLTLASIPPDDADVYRMIQHADTMGVFQIESRAQMSMLPRLRPRSFYDLVIEVAIVRPGPIQGNMVHPYLRRRQGIEPVTYPNAEIKEVLRKTLGVPLFQEQAMRLAVVAAGFTPGEADQLRRAMGAWRRPGVIDDFRRRLIDGMRRRGLSPEFAEHVFSQIRGFGEYGFPESHAASFALLVYVSAWLKHHYPAAFAAALINSQPMGFYAPAQLIRDARAHGVDVRTVDVNHSVWDCTLEAKDRGQEIESGACTASSRAPATGGSQQAEPDDTVDVSLRLGFRLIVGLARNAVERIEAARREGTFRSLDDFARRTALSRAALVQLSRADVFGSLAMDRRQATWNALAQEKKKADTPLFDSLAAEDDDEVLLPQLAAHDEVSVDYQTKGLTLRQHPIHFIRDQLDARNVVPASKLDEVPDGSLIRVAGLVLLRQRPSTAKGITFVTLEDETGQANLVVRPHIWQRDRRAARAATALIATGRLERRQTVTHLVVDRLEDLTAVLTEIPDRSRNFR